MSATSTSTTKHPRDADADASGAAASAKGLRSDGPHESPPAAQALATFWDLPAELRSMAFELAYKEVDEVNTSLASKRRPQLHLKTLLNLILVSHDFHSTFSPILYQDLKITHPSMLVEFQHSLILRPSNALHVKSLHLGPLAELSKGWWPIRWIEDPLDTDEPDLDDYADTDEPIVLVNTSLTSRDDAVRPRWCKPGQEWVHEIPWESFPCPRTCQDAAVTRAIKAALKGVGISLYNPDEQYCELGDAEGDFLSINVWTSRLFEAQAIVDLYLAEMRRIEETEERSVPSWQDIAPSSTPRGPDKCRYGRCAHYPRLDLAGFQGRRERKAEAVGRTTRAGGSSDGEGEWYDEAEHKAQRAKARRYRFTITLNEVKKHLGRRGTQIDHFDHPLLFARGGQRMLTLTPESRAQVVHGNYPYETRQRFYEYGYDDVDEFDSESKSLHVKFYEEGLSDSDFEIESSCSSDSSQSSPGSNASSGPTLDPPPSKNVMELGRSVLQLVHAVKNLSLTSYLARCIEPEAPSLSEVRCLSLGPLQPPEYISPCLANLKTPSLERLRVCGGDLSAEAAELLGNPAGELTELREVVWDYGALNLPSKDKTSERDEFLLEVLRLLQGGPTVKSAGEPDGSDQVVSSAVVRTAIDKGASPRQPSDSIGKARSIEVRVHPGLLGLLEHAASPEALAAWLDGSLLAGAPNQVRVMLSRAAVVRNIEDSESRLQYTKILLKDSEEWWEESAEECSQTVRATI